MVRELKMKHRKLRIAWSVGWGIAAGLLAALWFRSYWRTDVLFPRFTKSTALSRGQIYFNADCAWRDQHTRHWPVPGYYEQDLAITDIWAPDDRSIDVIQYGFRLPLWPAVIALPLAAVAPWLRSLVKLHFSLRTLLIATTLVAVGLGLVVWTVRN